MEAQVVEALTEAKAAAVPIRNNFCLKEKPAEYLALIRSKRKARRKMQKSKAQKLRIELEYRTAHPEIINFDDFLRNINTPSPIGINYDEIRAMSSLPLFLDSTITRLLNY